MVNINSITFDGELVKGWHKADDHDRGIGYMDHPESPSNIIMTDFNPFPLQLPVPLDDINAIRHFIKETVNSKGCGLVEADFVTAGGLKMIRAIEKQKQQPTGMAYKGSLTIPLPDSNFILRAWCFEVGITGFRDAMVADEFMAAGKLPPGQWDAWTADSYNLGPQPVMRNHSEDEKYDAQFPDHPLSRVRNFLNRMQSSLHYDPSPN